MPEMIPATLIPPGVNDRRSRDFVASLSAVLEDFRPSALLVQDPMTVDAAMLPILTVELGMSGFVAPGLLERHVRALLAAAPDIHAMTGLIVGVRRALGAIGVTVDWVQWWQQDPPGHHDTHVVTAYVNEHLFADQPALLSEEVQHAVLRLIEATQRWSQDIDFRVGIGFRTSAGLASALQAAAFFAPTLETVSQMPAAGIGLAVALQDVTFLDPTLEMTSPMPAASVALVGSLRHFQFLSVAMEAVA